MRAHRGVVLGVYVLARALPPRVALRGHLGQFPRVDDRRVAKLLTWPWWSSAALVTLLLKWRFSPYCSSCIDSPVEELGGVSPTVALVVDPQ